jgi:hypothetical protein
MDSRLVTLAPSSVLVTFLLLELLKVVYLIEIPRSFLLLPGYEYRSINGRDVFLLDDL